MGRADIGKDIARGLLRSDLNNKMLHVCPAVTYLKKEGIVCDAYATEGKRFFPALSNGLTIASVNVVEKKKECKNSTINKRMSCNIQILKIKRDC